MHEIVVGMILVTCATMLGNSFSQMLVNRHNSLQRLIESIEKMKTLISFSANEISEVLANAFMNVNGFEEFTVKQDESVTFSQWWQERVSNLDRKTGLDKEDRMLLLRFSEGIGVSDVEGQMSNCDLYVRLFSERLTDATEAMNVKCRLYKILGFSLGCAVTLMIV